MPVPTFNNHGSLLTYKVEGQDKETCLGYLFDFQDKGVFSPEFGRVEVASGDMKAHNEALSKAEIDGLDTCAVAQGGTFYYLPAKGVCTWIGTVVSPPNEVTVKRSTITFKRNGRIFRGKLSKNVDCFNFQRVS